MRFLVIIKIGLVLSITSCKQDPILGYDVCKPEARPEITDSGNHVTSNKLKGEWQLINTVSYEGEGFLEYRVLEEFLKSNNEGRKPVLEFKDKRKLLVLEPVNQCHFNYYLTSKNGEKWLNTNWKNTLGCTAKLPPEEIRSWEQNYQSAIMNSTCYEINNNKLTVQYYIGENKKGEVVYKK